MARKLWLHNGDEAMFVVLKQTVPAAEWHQFIDSLVEDLRREPHRVAPLYAQEQRWEDLLKLIKSSSRPHLLLEDYYKQLAVRFPDEVAAIYEHTIENMLQVASNRETYQQVVSYLHRIIRLVGEERGIEIAEQLRSRYANRRALLDELGRL